MKVLFLNLPNHEQITRRYMCSYPAPDSLLPPLELASCAAVARAWNNAEVKLIDSIAAKKNITGIIAEINTFKPDVIVSLTGFECYQQDVECFREMKSNYPDARYVFFGHYATHFPYETIFHSGADYVVLGEPELVISNLFSAIAGKAELTEVEGIAYLQNGKFVAQGTASRIKNPNELPVPAYDLLQKGKYYEPLIPKPYGMIQTLRGCPYSCSYCVKSYGSKVSQLGTERIIEEMKAWKSLFGVKAIRFIDDTFTINRIRVIELCKSIIDENLGIEWSCLTRTDCLDKELLHWMKNAGCTRIYFGLESGSQKMLDLYKKNVNAKEAMGMLKLCRKMGIETAGFFIGGHPDETEEDFQQTIQFAREAQLNYIACNFLTAYPGTPFYDRVKDDIEFSIYPYKNKWKNHQVYADFERRKDRFYKSFYFRPAFMLETIPLVFKNFREIVSLGFALARYLFWDKQFIIGGLKGANDK